MPRPPKVSETTRTLSGRVYGDLASRALASAGRVFPLNVGDTWIDPPPAAMAEPVASDAGDRLFAYSPVQGEPDLLDAILAHHGGALARDQVQVTSGATVGLSVLAHTLLDPGDEVLLPSPYWPLVRGLVAGRGAVPVEIPFYDRLPDLDVEAVLEAAVTDRTVAVYVNTPHNPTGKILGPEHLDAVARVALRHDLWVLTDEAYDQLWYRSPPPPPLWTREDLKGRVFATHTLSKSHGLAGARIGWIHGPAEAMAAVRGVQTFENYCAARPMQRAAARALAEDGGWIARAREQYRDAAWTAAEILRLPVPAGGTFLFFDGRPYLKAGENLQGLLERCADAGVLLTPGGASGRDYGDWLRLCFTAVPPDDLREAVERLAGVLGVR